MLVIYQESLYDARSTKCTILRHFVYTFVTYISDRSRHVCCFTVCDSLSYNSSYGVWNNRMNACVFHMVIARPMFLVKISALCIVWVKVMVNCCWLINKFLFA